MKKIIFPLLLSTVFLSGCYEKILVNRTISKDIVLNFNINHTGNFVVSSNIDSRKVLNLFTENDTKFSRHEIKSLDIKSFSMGAVVNPANTASTISGNASVTAGDAGGVKTSLLNDFKTVQITSSTLGDIMSGLGNVTGVDKSNVTFRNAVEVLNASGIEVLKKNLQSYLVNNQSGFIFVHLTGQVPPQSRAVINIVVKISATITYARCEEIAFPIYSSGINECEID